MDLELVMLGTMGGLLLVCIVLAFKAKKEVQNIQNNLQQLQEKIRVYND